MSLRGDLLDGRPCMHVFGAYRLMQVPAIKVHLYIPEVNSRGLGAPILMAVLSRPTPVSSQISNGTTPSLNPRAISASNGASILECWQLPGFVFSSVAGTIGALHLFLGDLSNATYTVIPSRFDGGVHNAPALSK